MRSPASIPTSSPSGRTTTTWCALIAAAVIVVGCSSDDAASPIDSAPAPIESGSATTTTPEFDLIVESDTPPTPVEPLYEAGDIDAGLQPFIDLATTDLAGWLDVDEAAISTHAAVLVLWPDASLGCPEPGLQYAQLDLDGSLIELDHDGQIYRYHTGGRTGLFTCPTPLAEAPPGVDVAG